MTAALGTVTTFGGTGLRTGWRAGVGGGVGIRDDAGSARTVLGRAGTTCGSRMGTEEVIRAVDRCGWWYGIPSQDTGP